MPFHPFRIILSAVLVLCAQAAGATGVQPETSLLVLREGDSSNQMAVLNTDNEPLLLHTTIIDVADDKGPAVYALPPVTRMEAKGRQIVRFVLERSGEPLKVQHMKRVRFEGIPDTSKDKGKSIVRMTVAHEMPIVISPKGLEQDPEPWKLLKWQVQGGKLKLSNPSPFVARLGQEVELGVAGAPAASSVKRFKVLARPYVLPGADLTLELPKELAPADLAAAPTLRIFPASPYGYGVGSYDAPLAH